MRIRTINIRGYGRFSERVINFVPGLQVVVGPNERGKSTIRSFIVEMLYGQKVNDTQRIFEESNELRNPWNGNGIYGGSLIYELDDGRSIEVIRDFDRQREKVEVLDHISGEDITGTFNRFRNRELDFALQHLGLSKDVFLNTATISHLSLDGLGDSEALDQIREKLLSLADTGGGNGTVEGAMRLLGERVAAIGLSGAKSKPLAQARETLISLEAAHKEAVASREASAELALERQALLERCQELRRERQAAEAALKMLEMHEERDRLAEACRLQGAIDETTRQCLALGAVREIPLDRDQEMQGLHDAVRTAKNQLETTQAQKTILDKRLHEEAGGDEGGTLILMAPEFPNALEKQLNEATAARVQLEERITETEALIKAAQDRMEEVRRQLAEMPDFSRLAADPVEWLSQLASSFSVAMRARDEECGLRATCRDEVDTLMNKNAPYRELFEEQENFSEIAREYALQLRLYESQKEQHASTLHTLQGTYAELQGESRAFLPMGAACIAVAVLIGGIGFFTDFGNTLIATGLAGLVGLIFLAMWGTQRGHMKRLASRIEEAREAVNSVSKAAGKPELECIDVMLQTSGLASVRELEALHDQYRTVEVELKVRGEALAVQEEKAQEAEERIPLLLERFKETFAKAGEEINDENDVQNAAGRAIARYQEYRETKRRSTANRSVLERHEAELKRLQALAKQGDIERDGMECEAREFIAKNGLRDFGANESVQEAIAAYRNAFAQNREAQGRQDLLGENLRDAERQLDRDTQELEQCQAALAAAFRPFAVDSIEAWNGLIVAAGVYQELSKERRMLEDECAKLLGQDTLAALRERVDTAGDLGERPDTEREVLRETIVLLNDTLETETDQEHALHLRLAEQSSATRSLSELEEELA
ncbi:MAG: AAA family ATPase, partial [Candidatus Hydrogenedentes bacterium]|nr:AAA family ATPase [Candidatus Hydrogenedentota bacterium]